MDYPRRGELVIHNASFDIGFMDYEFSKPKPRHRKNRDLWQNHRQFGAGAKMFPGKRNSLDALCSRYE